MCLEILRQAIGSKCLYVIAVPNNLAKRNFVFVFQVELVSHKNQNGDFNIDIRK